MPKNRKKDVPQLRICVSRHTTVMRVQKRTMLKTLVFNVVCYLYEVLYVIRRKTECNHFVEMYVIDTKDCVYTFGDAIRLRQLHTR